MGLTKTSFPVTGSDVVCYSGNNYSSSWSSGTVTSNKHFCASWTEWYDGYLSNSNQKRSRITINTDAAGAATLNISISITGRHAWTASQTVGKIYCVVSSAANANPSSGSQMTLNGTAVGSTATATLPVALLPYSTYYVWIWCTATTDTYGGTATIAASGTYGTPGEITANNANFGSDVNMSYASDTSGATYTVSVAVPKTDGTNWTSTLQTKSSTPSRSWTPAVATFAPLITDRQSVTATITVSTYFGNTLAGTKTKSITLTFLAADVGITGATGWCNHAEDNSSVSGSGSTMNGYIQNYSKSAVTVDHSKLTLVNTTLASWSAKLGSTTISPDNPSTASITIGPVTQNTTLEITATDGRGFSVSETFNITVLPYALPSVDAVYAKSGSSMTITATATYSPLTYNSSDQNSVSIKLYMRQAGQSSWGGAIALDDGVQETVSSLADITYEMKLEVTDLLTNTGVKEGMTLYSDKHVLQSRPAAAGIAFGKAAEHDGRAEIPSDWDYYRGLKKILPVDEIYPVGSIYMSVNSTDPGTLFGGTWERITGAFLLAATDNGSSGAAQAAGNTGGEASHTLTVTELPAHHHEVYSGWSAQSGAADAIYYGAYTGAYRNNGNGNVQFIHDTGGNGAHNNMPPYLSVYVWKRTA